MRKSEAGFSRLHKRHQVAIFRLRLLFECSFCAPWVWRKASQFESGFFQVRFLYVTSRKGKRHLFSSTTVQNISQWRTWDKQEKKKWVHGRLHQVADTQCWQKHGWQDQLKLKYETIQTKGWWNRNHPPLPNATYLLPGAPHTAANSRVKMAKVSHRVPDTSVRGSKSFHAET